MKLLPLLNHQLYPQIQFLVLNLKVMYRLPLPQFWILVLLQKQAALLLNCLLQLKNLPVLKHPHLVPSVHVLAAQYQVKNHQLLLNRFPVS